MTIEQMKAWVNQASYEELLSKWRFASIGDPFFSTPEVSEYFHQHLIEKRRETTDDGVAASKRIGW